jgi:hypothetical protein
MVFLFFDYKIKRGTILFLKNRMFDENKENRQYLQALAVGFIVCG